jgi:hypothetical protein
MIELSVDSRELRDALRRIGDRGADGHVPLTLFYQEWKAATLTDWSAIRAPGGSFRGAPWRGMKAQYTRKTDGVEVPAWGGVPRMKRKYTHTGDRIKWVKGRAVRIAPMVKLEKAGDYKRTVKGKKRPSGKRVTTQSVINMDTGALKNAILTARPRIISSAFVGTNGGQILRIGGDLPDYAKHALKELDRNPLFFTSEDNLALMRHCRSYWQRLIRDRGRV